MQHIPVIQENKNMKIWFVMNIFEKLDLSEYQIYAFLPLSVKMGC